MPAVLAINPVTRNSEKPRMKAAGIAQSWQSTVNEYPNLLHQVIHLVRRNHFVHKSEKARSIELEQFTEGGFVAQFSSAPPASVHRVVARSTRVLL